MGKRSEQKRKTYIESQMDRVRLIEKIDKTKLKIAKRLGREYGISMHSKNIGEIARTKIECDLMPQFRDVGIDFWEDCTITRAVMRQIVTYLKNGEGFLDEYNRTLMPKQEQVLLQKANRFPKIIARIRRFLAIPQKIEEHVTAENVEQAKQKINLYYEASEKMASYSLRENIVEAIVNQLCPEGGPIQLGCFVPKLINDEIAPILNQLGLEDLLPKLQEQLEEKYKILDEESPLVADACKMHGFEERSGTRK